MDRQVSLLFYSIFVHAIGPRCDAISLRALIFVAVAAGLLKANRGPVYIGNTAAGYGSIGRPPQAEFDPRAGICRPLT